MKIHKALYAIILLSVLSTGCSQAGAVELATATIAPTVTTAPTPTQEVDQVEQLLTAHLAGESIDVSSLSPTEFREFSTQLAEQRNEERGINPIIYNGEAYLDPNSYRLMDYDGHPDMNETIQMYLPVVGKDSAGNLQIRNQNGQIVTIANSADVDWNMVVTDLNDPRIDWPNLPEVVDGLNEINWHLSDHFRNTNKTFIVPAILLDKTMGQIFMEGRGKGFIPLFRFLTVAETDVSGEPLLFRLSLMIPNTTQLAIENSDFWTKAYGVSVMEEDDFYINLQENSVYYMGNYQDQGAMWDFNYNTTMDAYQGLITDNEITSILTHQGGNTQDMMLLPPSLLILKK